jgi:hypothetical protein
MGDWYPAPGSAHAHGIFDQCVFELISKSFVAGIFSDKEHDGADGATSIKMGWFGIGVQVMPRNLVGNTPKRTPDGSKAVSLIDAKQGDRIHRLLVRLTITRAKFVVLQRIDFQVYCLRE